MTNHGQRRGLFFLQERQTGLLVFGDFVSRWQRVDRARAWLACEIVEGYFLPAPEFLQTRVKIVRLA